MFYPGDYGLIRYIQLLLREQVKKRAQNKLHMTGLCMRSYFSRYLNELQTMTRTSPSTEICMRLPYRLHVKIIAWIS
jgi:hypothetical protein